MYVVLTGSLAVVAPEAEEERRDLRREVRESFSESSPVNRCCAPVRL